MQKASLQENSRVTVGIVGASFVYRLPGIVSEFKEPYENVKVKTLRLNIDPLAEALRTGTLDVGFLFLDNINQKWQKDFGQYCIERGTYQVAMPSSNPLSTKKSVCISELKNCNFAILDRRQSHFPHNELIRCCMEAGFEPNIVAEYSYIEPLLTMVNMGEAITLTSSLAPLKGLDSICCVDLENFPPIELYMFYFVH